MDSLSGGGVDGTEWKADLSAEASFEQVAEVAKKSILKSDPEKIKAAAVAVEKHIKSLQALESKFKLEPMDTAECDSIVKKAWLTYYEGRFVGYLIKVEGSPERIASSLNKFVREMFERRLASAKIHPAVWLAVKAKTRIGTGAKS